jgi:hypothetical protein
MTLGKFILIAGFLPVAFQAFSQDSISEYAVQDSISLDIDIFAEEEPAQITLIYDMKEFKKKGMEDEYINAELIYHLGDSTMDRSSTVRIKARGIRRKEICSFPPIMINIKKSNIDNVHLQEVNKIKLVTHCSGTKTFERYVLKEYLAYKIYNLFSPYSFRVRLVRMKYIDTSRKNKEMNSWAFLIEPETMMADRMNKLPFKSDMVSIHQTDTLWTDRMCMFQYMIGNTDYSVRGRHNIKLLRNKDYSTTSLIPVPYDFDYCGMVDTHYAVPGENLGISSVRERYFLGPCRDTRDFQAIIDELASLKEEIIQLVHGFEYLPESERKTVITYLDEYFQNSVNPRFLENSILSTCSRLQK